MPSTWTKRLLLVSLVALLASFASPPLRAQTTSTWNGGSGNWSNPSNWTPNGLPGSNTDVFINISDPIGANIFFDLLQSSVQSLSVGAGNTLHVNGLLEIYLGNTYVAGTLNATHMTGSTLFVDAGGIVNGGSFSGIYVAPGGVANGTGLGGFGCSTCGSLHVDGEYNNTGYGVLSFVDHGHISGSGTFNNAGSVFIGPRVSGSMGTFRNTATGELTIDGSSAFFSVNVLENFGAIHVGGGEGHLIVQNLLNDGVINLNNIGQILFAGPNISGTPNYVPGPVTLTAMARSIY